MAKKKQLLSPAQQLQACIDAGHWAHIQLEQEDGFSKDELNRLRREGVPADEMFQWAELLAVQRGPGCYLPLTGGSDINRGVRVVSPHSDILAALQDIDCPVFIRVFYREFDELVKAARGVTRFGFNVFYFKGSALVLHNHGAGAQAPDQLWQYGGTNGMVYEAFVKLCLPGQQQAVTIQMGTESRDFQLSTLEAWACDLVGSGAWKLEEGWGRLKHGIKDSTAAGKETFSLGVKAWLPCEPGRDGMAKGSKVFHKVVKASLVAAAKVLLESNSKLQRQQPQQPAAAELVPAQGLTHRLLEAHLLRLEPALDWGSLTIKGADEAIDSAKAQLALQVASTWSLHQGRKVPMPRVIIEELLDGLTEDEQQEHRLQLFICDAAVVDLLIRAWLHKQLASPKLTWLSLLQAAKQLEKRRAEACSFINNSIRQSGGQQQRVVLTRFSSGLFLVHSFATGSLPVAEFNTLLTSDKLTREMRGYLVDLYGRMQAQKLSVEEVWQLLPDLASLHQDALLTLWRIESGVRGSPYALLRAALDVENSSDPLDRAKGEALMATYQQQGDELRRKHQAFILGEGYGFAAADVAAGRELWMHGYLGGLVASAKNTLVGINKGTFTTSQLTLPYVFWKPSKDDPSAHELNEVRYKAVRGAFVHLLHGRLFGKGLHVRTSLVPVARSPLYLLANARKYLKGLSEEAVQIDVWDTAAILQSLLNDGAISVDPAAAAEILTKVEKAEADEQDRHGVQGASRVLNQRRDKGLASMEVGDLMRHTLVTYVDGKDGWPGQVPLRRTQAGSSTVYAQGAQHTYRLRVPPTIPLDTSPAARKEIGKQLLELCKLSLKEETDTYDNRKLEARKKGSQGKESEQGPTGSNGKAFGDDDSS